MSKNVRSGALSRWRLVALSVAALIYVGQPLGAQTSQPTSQPASQPTSQPTTATVAKFVPSSDPFIAAIEEAHGAEAWQSHAAVQCDISIEFGGKQTLEGKMLYETSGKRSRLDLANGTKLVFDGEHAWVFPASSDARRPRFTLLTYPYFLAVPFKLRDPGVSLSPPQPMDLDGRIFDVAHATFAPGTGDSPNDWYDVWSDSGNHRIMALGYIVTYGKSDADVQSAEAHAISYDDFLTTGGVTLPMSWSFRAYKLGEGPYNEPIGKATLSNLTFVKPSDTDFAKPEGAREDLPPRK